MSGRGRPIDPAGLAEWPGGDAAAPSGRAGGHAKSAAADGRDVPTGAVRTTRGEQLTVGALGSCVAVMALDDGSRIGGIAHVMLPGKAPPSATGRRTRYAEDGILQLLGSLSGLGADLGGLTCGLVGAGNVLRREDGNICSDNIRSVQEVLAREGVRVTASHLGGDLRRSCSLDAAAGLMIYTVGDSPPRVLWKRKEPDG